METLLGIRGADFVMVAADCVQASSIVVMKSDHSKLHTISDNIIMAAIGDAGDANQFTEFISKNIALYKMRNGYELSPKSAAHFTRRNLADYLRSRTPYQVNMFLAGFDAKDGPELHYIDYLANGKTLNYGAQGYGGFFSSSIFDRYWHKDVTEQEAYEILQKCVVEIQKRLIINLKNFKVAVIDKDGIRYLEDITSAKLDAMEAATSYSGVGRPSLSGGRSSVGGGGSQGGQGGQGGGGSQGGGSQGGQGGGGSQGEAGSQGGGGSQGGQGGGGSQGGGSQGGQGGGGSQGGAGSQGGGGSQGSRRSQQEIRSH